MYIPYYNREVQRLRCIYICALLRRFTLHLAKCKLTSPCVHLETGGLTLYLAPNGDMFPCVTKSNRT